MTTKKQINLFRGWPNYSLLPTAALKAAAITALSNPSISNPGLEYGPDPGFLPLRKSIATWLATFYNSNSQDSASSGDVKSGEENICITGGASQNLACALQVYSDPGITTVWMVAPCYYLACNIFADAGLDMRAVGQGNDGIDLGALEEGMKSVDSERNKTKAKTPQPHSKIYDHIIYSVPTFSNPGGLTMSFSTRKSLVLLARKYNALLITDDVYDLLQWPLSMYASSTGLSNLPSPSTLKTALVPRLSDIDATMSPIPGPNDFGNAMSNGSFSKLAGPGLRTGWAAASPKVSSSPPVRSALPKTYKSKKLIYECKFINGLSQCGSTRSGGAPSQLVATFMSVLLEEKKLQEHIETVLKPSYQRRHSILMSAVRNHLQPLGVSVQGVRDDSSLASRQTQEVEEKGIFGGYFIWLLLPSTVSANTLATRCLEEENLVIAPGHLFEVQGDSSLQFQNEARLCFAWEGEDELQEGVERMGKVLKRMINGTKDMKGGESGSGMNVGEFK